MTVNHDSEFFHLSIPSYKVCLAWLSLLSSLNHCLRANQAKQTHHFLNPREKRKGRKQPRYAKREPRQGVACRVGKPVNLRDCNKKDVLIKPNPKR